MKRISIALLAGFFFTTLAMAQITYFNQHGRATRELNAEGMALAHPILPLNARVMLTNTLTGETIEATVVGRIAPSLERVAALSHDAWEALGLAPDNEIRIFTNAAVMNDVAVAPPLNMNEENGVAQVTPVDQAGQFNGEGVPGPGQQVAANGANGAIAVVPVVEAPVQVIAPEPVQQVQPVLTEADLLERLLTLMARQEAQAMPSVVVNVNPYLAQNVEVHGTAQSGPPAVYRNVHTPVAAEPPAPAAPEVIAQVPPIREEPQAEHPIVTYAPQAGFLGIDPELMARILAIEARLDDQAVPQAAPQPVEAYVPQAAPAAVDPELMARILAIEAAILEEMEALQAVEAYVPQAVPAAIDPEILARILALEALEEALLREIAQPVEPAPQAAAPSPAVDPEIVARLLALEAMQEAREREADVIPPQVAVLPPVPHDTVLPLRSIGPIAPEIMATLYDPEIIAMLEVLEAREAARLPISAPHHNTPPPAFLPGPRVMVQPVPEPIVQPAPPPVAHPVPQRSEPPVLEPVVQPIPLAAPIVQPVPLAPPAVQTEQVQPVVSPALPDPSSGRVYRLQVGAFSTMDAANRISQLLSSVGFSVVQEHNGTTYRVLAVNVPAAMVHPAVQRLGVIGIAQVWIRE